MENKEVNKVEIDIYYEGVMQVDPILPRGSFTPSRLYRAVAKVLGEPPTNYVNHVSVEVLESLHFLERWSAGTWRLRDEYRKIPKTEKRD